MIMIAYSKTNNATKLIDAIIACYFSLGMYFMGEISGYALIIILPAMILSFTSLLSRDDGNISLRSLIFTTIICSTLLIIYYYIRHR
jgi:hypothetical protein